MRKIVHNTEDSCHSSQEWISSQIYPKVNAVFREVQEVQELHHRSSLNLLSVKVHEGKSRRFFFLAARRKPLLTKRNLDAQLRFSKLHLNKAQDVWNRSRVELFCLNPQQHVSAESLDIHCQAQWWRRDD